MTTETIPIDYIAGEKVDYGNREEALSVIKRGRSSRGEERCTAPLN
jgi:hypothetical protein